MVVYIGTSGWQYRHWRDAFYPPGLAQRRWLDHYAARFQTVELNNSFYHLPTAHSFERWREETPADFVVAAKMSSYLTHLKRLRDPGEPVRLFLERAGRLEQKLGPILLQMPPQLTAEPGRLAETLDCFPAGVRVAVEFRHDSWYQPQVRSLLERHGAALCLADSPRRRTPEWRTADWGFLRFHEGRATPRPCYGERALLTWADRLSRLWRTEEDVFCYFNNDPRGCAIRDAITFARLLDRAGFATTRVPRSDEITVNEL
ncbi:MAG: DUF72 domain-containing protein [Candidatus Dormiibacter spiritus]|nr:MAG: DUF72 domain-containing protein [Candidatus Dormibacteraeota bacterium]